MAEKALSVVDVPIVDGRLAPTSLEGMWRVSNALYKSGLLPGGVKSPEAALVLVTAAMELKIGYLDAITGIGVINGKPCLHSRLPMMLAMRTGQFAGMDVGWDGKEGTDSLACRVTVRRMMPMPDGKFTTLSFTGYFSMADAKAAGLLGKDIWKNYAKDMLLARARSRALNQAFADAMGGLSVVQPDDEAEVFDRPKRVVATIEGGEPDSDPIDSIPDESAPKPVDAPQSVPASDPPQSTPKPAAKPTAKPPRPRAVYDRATDQITPESEAALEAWERQWEPEKFLIK